MRWVLAAIFVLLLLGNASSVFAATSENVTVTATGFICEAPAGFTVTRISDQEVEITWAKGEGAENTMIRGKYGEYPANRDDGYEVYYGAGTNVTDTSMHLDETAGKLFYRAWSQNDGEIWAEDFAEGWTQGIGMTLIAIVVLTLGLLGYAIHYKQTALMFLAAAAGIALAVYGFANMSGSGQDAYWVLGIIGAVLAIVAAMMAGLAMRSGPSGDIESVDDAYARELRESRPGRKRQRR